MTSQALFPHVEAKDMHPVTSVEHLKVWAGVLYGAWYVMERDVARKMHGKTVHVPDPGERLEQKEILAFEL